MFERCETGKDMDIKTTIIMQLKLKAIHIEIIWRKCLQKVSSFKRDIFKQIFSFCCMLMKPKGKRLSSLL